MDQSVKDEATESDSTEAEAAADVRATVTRAFRTQLIEKLGAARASEAAGIPLFFVSSHAWRRQGAAQYDERAVCDFVARSATARSAAAVDSDNLWAWLCERFASKCERFASKV